MIDCSCLEWMSTPINTRPPLQVVKGFVPVDRFGNFVSGGATEPPNIALEGMGDTQRENPGFTFLQL